MFENHLSHLRIYEILLKKFKDHRVRIERVGNYHVTGDHRQGSRAAG